MSGGQITIPTFDDDDDLFTTSAAIPFGRQPTTTAFGALHATPAAGRESPVPVGVNSEVQSQRQYFHSRGDSSASQSSSYSLSTSTTAVGSTSVAKKPSFANIRNPFSKTKTSQASTLDATPPLPDAYPALRNPFARSPSALSQATQPSDRPSNSRHGGSGSAKSSFSRSTLETVTGSPLRQAPAAGTRLRDESFGSDNEEHGSSVSNEPRAPTEFALRALFTDFVQIADSKLDEFLKAPLDAHGEPALIKILGPGAHPPFDRTLASLAQLAQKHAAKVVESISRWKKTHNDPVNPDITKHHVQTSIDARIIRTSDVKSILSDRKAVASDYILCRALIVVLGSVPPNGLGERLGTHLEQLTFNQYQASGNLLHPTTNQRSIAQLYGQLLSQLSSIRFVSLTDRFLAELAPLATGQVVKEAEPRFEHVVRGLRYIQMKAWPPEVFEEAAEFMEQLAKCYSNVHGSRMKIVFAEVLTQLLHPIGKTAQAEVNHPTWAKALEVVYLKTKEMMTKRQYWSSAYPLLVVSLCVAPRDFFLQNWSWCFEMGATKLKDRSGRLLILNALIRLVWVYLYRCNEPASSVLVKLATITKFFFPPSRSSSSWTPDDPSQMDILVYVVHFILLRHVEFGQELVSTLVQEPSNSNASSFHVTEPDRVVVGIRAVLVTLKAMEKDVTVPIWPSSWDLNSPIPTSDYPAAAERLNDEFWESPMRASVGDFYHTRCARHIETLALSIGAKLARCHYFDAQYALTRLGDTMEERDAFILRDHREDGRAISIAYSRALVPEIGIVQACFDAIPRCLSSVASKLDPLLDTALETVVNVEPALGAAAERALLRMARDTIFSSRTALHATRFLFSHSQVLTGPGEIFLMVEQEPLLKLWLAIVEAWTSVVLAAEKKTNDSEDVKSPDDVSVVFREIQAAAIFLVAYNGPILRSAGATVLRLFHSSTLPVSSEDCAFHAFFRTQGLLVLDNPTHSAQLDAQYRARHAHWKKQKHDDILLRVMESTNAVDRPIWVSMEAALFQQSWDQYPRVSRLCRNTLLAAVLRYHPVVAASAGLKSTVTPGGSRSRGRDAIVVDQWTVWVRLLCCTAFDGQASGGRPPPETGAGSLETQWERISSARGLFWHLISFLAAETGNGRYAVITALGSVPAIAVQGLLEDLQRITQYIFDGKAPRMSRSDRLHYAVAHVHNLVSDHLDDPIVSRGPAMQLIVQFVCDTETFLRRPDIMRMYDMQKLRKQFCCIVEKLFNQSDVLQVPGLPNPLSIYTLCDEWCQYGPRSPQARARYTAMHDAAVAKWAEKEKEAAAQRFHNESVHLSVAASGACTALCKVAIDYALNPPPTNFIQSGTTPDAPDLAGMLERFLAMLGSSSANVLAYGRRGVHTLLTSLPIGHPLSEDVAHRAFVSSDSADTTDSRFFEMLEQVVTGGESHPLTFEQLVATGLSNLSNSQLAVRKRALRTLEHALSYTSPNSTLRHLAASVCSAAPSVYLAAVQRVSNRIASQHTASAGYMIAEITGLLLDTAAEQRVHGVLLQSLRPWIATIDLLPDGFVPISEEGARVILNLLALTSRYYTFYCEELRDLWAAVADVRQPMNGGAMVQFLIDLVTARDNSKLTAEAVRAVACLSSSEAGSRAIQDLCNLIDPRSILPPQENISIPVSVLDTLFPRSSSRSGLARGQVAFVLLSDLAVERAWELKHQLPIILNILFIHLDHKTSYLRDHALRLLLHTVRLWMPGYEELSIRVPRPAVDEAYERIEDMQCLGADAFKASSNSKESTDEAFSRLLDDVLTVLEPLHPTLRQDWGELAVVWGTSCAIRPLAFGSLKLFRLMMPSVNANMLGAIIGRLSNTVSDPDEHIQAFTVEIIRTMTSLLQSSELDITLVPQIFWCTLACLSTTVEEEYVQTLSMTKALLSRIDLNDEDTALYLQAMRPDSWSSASADLQSSVLVGLRSSVTTEASWNLLQKIVQLNGPPFIGSPTGRVRDAFAVCIPWCLQAMDDKIVDDMAEFAMNLSQLAEVSGYPSIQRVMVSFAKQRFRTRDDFLRQALSSLREHFAASMADICTLLLGLVLNKTQWIQLRTMEVLKVLFTHRETWNPIRLSGSDLLMPLLRLLPTEMSSQALDVLDQPIAVFGGPSAAQVVRMSMQNVKPNIFGPPQESGWSIAKPEHARTLTRMNLLAVFDTCKVLGTPSDLVFQQDDEITSPVSVRSQRLFGNGSPSPATGRGTVYGISELLSNLHALTSYFADDGPSHDAESKVNAILGPRQGSHRAEFSLDSTVDLSNTQIPPTPLIDLFSSNGNGRHQRSQEGYFPDFDQSDSDDANFDSFSFDDGEASALGGRMDLTGLGFGRAGNGTHTRRSSSRAG